MKFLLVFVLLGAFAASAMAQQVAPAAPASSPSAAASSPSSPFTISVGGGTETGNVSTAIQLVALMTVLTLAPSIVMLMTSFTRIVIVLGFVRSALGVQNSPSNQIIIGLALFLTIFIMAPIGTRINDEAIQPYMAKKITPAEAYDKATGPLKQFMLRQTRPSEIDFFLSVSGAGPTKVKDLSMAVVVPAFVVSELRTAFQMGFLVFIPFLIIDFIVSSALMSMGMMMMPPTMIAMPFKILLFVLVDGWHLIIRSLVESFGL
jgi:flagellar biosynthetic protein FliP